MGSSENACKNENKLKSRLGYLEGTIKSLTSRLEEITESIHKTQDAVSEHDSKMTKISEKLKKYKTSAKERKQKIDGLEAKLLEYDSKFQLLESQRIQNFQGSAENREPSVNLNQVKTRNTHISSGNREILNSGISPKKTSKKNNQIVSQSQSSCRTISKKKRRLNFQILAASEKHHSLLGYKELPSNLNTTNFVSPTFTVTTESSNSKQAEAYNENKIDTHFVHSDVNDNSKPTGKKSQFSAEFPGFQLKNFFVVCEQLDLSDYSSCTSSLQGGSTSREKCSDLGVSGSGSGVGRWSSAASLDSYNYAGQTTDICETDDDSIGEEFLDCEINNEMPEPRRSEIRIVKKGLNTRFLCKFCNRTFSAHRSVGRHMEVAHTHNHPQKSNTDSSASQSTSKLNNYRCDYCSLHFKSKFHLGEHVKSHLPERPFACSAPKCSKSFKRKCHLLEHLKSHSSTNFCEFPCTKCGQIFKRNHELQRHFNEVHLKEKDHNLYECHICHKTIKYSYNLTRHLKQHEENQDQPEETARSAAPNKTITSNNFSEGVLPSPVKVIIPNIPGYTNLYDCPECGKTFGKRDHFACHMKTHSGEKLYMCQVEGCGKSFTQNSQLKTHQVTHTKERNFHCPESDCGQSFSLKKTLTQHLQTHGNDLLDQGEVEVVKEDGENGVEISEDAEIIENSGTSTAAAAHRNTFSCTRRYCGKRFEYKQSLLKHMTFAHGTFDLLECQQCKRYFCSQKGLDRHMPYCLK